MDRIIIIRNTLKEAFSLLTSTCHSTYCYIRQIRKLCSVFRNIDGGVIINPLKSFGIDELAITMANDVDEDDEGE